MTFTLCREAIQIMGIFAYLEGDEKFARFQIFNLTESRQGNMDMIPNTPNLKDDMGGGFGYQFTIKIIVHFVYLVELLWACASTTAMVTILTISRTELSNCKTCSGLFIPRRIGPTASASPTTYNNIKAIFPDSRFGKNSVFAASPFKVETGKLLSNNSL